LGDPIGEELMQQAPTEIIGSAVVVVVGAGVVVGPEVVVVG
jgi:hypothetical protein